MRTFPARRSPRDHFRVAQELLSNAEQRLTEGKEKGSVINICALALTNVVVGFALEFSDARRRKNNQ